MTNTKFLMNNKLNNIKFINLTNILLIIGSFLFLLVSFLILFFQRNNSLKLIDYSGIYILIATVFIIILFISLASLVLPIILRVRRKKISTLNSKFTLYFISIALTPALLLGILGLILINFGINDWFNSKINNVINNSVFVAESYLEEHKETIKGDVYAMYNDLNNSSDIFYNDEKKLSIALRTQALIRSLPETYILNRDGDIISKAFEKNPFFYNPPENAFKRADAGEMTIMSSTQVNKVYALVKLNNFDNSYLYAGRSMDGNVISALNDTISARNEYTFLETNRDQISLIFILIYIIISLILILLSTIVGIKFANRIVLPISSIITASNNISKGSYDDKISKTNDYIELNRLAESFNKMSNDIVKQRKQILISKKHETWSDIARRIAHEIKNPLTPIQLSSERLEKSIKKINGDNSDIDECIQIIRRQVNEIGLLVDEFSNFARLPNPKFQDENICDIIVKIINEYKSTYPKIIFDFKLQKEKFNLNIDRSQISRAFQNIIINSIQSIKESNNKFGKILISTYENNINFIISIKDNGDGLKYEKDDLLKPYFTTKKKSGGSGLGLSIVEKILFDHNAEFSIDNRTDGIKGAEVIIKFEK